MYGDVIMGQLGSASGLCTEFLMHDEVSRSIIRECVKDFKLHSAWSECVHVNLREGTALCECMCLNKWRHSALIYNTIVCDFMRIYSVSVCIAHIQVTYIHTHTLGWQELQGHELRVLD